MSAPKWACFRANRTSDLRNPAPGPFLLISVAPYHWNGKDIITNRHETATENKLFLVIHLFSIGLWEIVNIAGDWESWRRKKWELLLNHRLSSLAAVLSSTILAMMTSFGGVNQNSDGDMTSFLIWATKESQICLCWWWTFRKSCLEV